MPVLPRRRGRPGGHRATGRPSISHRGSASRFPGCLHRANMLPSGGATRNLRNAGDEGRARHAQERLRAGAGIVAETSEHGEVLGSRGLNGADSDQRGASCDTYTLHWNCLCVYLLFSTARAGLGRPRFRLMTPCGAAVLGTARLLTSNRRQPHVSFQEYHLRNDGQLWRGVLHSHCGWGGRSLC